MRGLERLAFLNIGFGRRLPMKICSFCAESIQEAAVVCRYCRRDLPTKPQAAREATAVVLEPVTSLVEPPRWRLSQTIIACTIAVFVIIVIAVNWPRESSQTAALRRELAEDPTAFKQKIDDMERSLAGQPARSTGGVTYANFQRLTDGMSYAEAVQILGSSGKEMSRSDLGGTTTIMYGWDAKGFANMNAMFQNDKIVSKAQFGLR